jgi:hypothetical protein
MQEVGIDSEIVESAENRVPEALGCIACTLAEKRIRDRSVYIVILRSTRDPLI